MHPQSPLTSTAARPPLTPSVNAALDLFNSLRREVVAPPLSASPLLPTAVTPNPAARPAALSAAVTKSIAAFNNIRAALLSPVPRHLLFEEGGAGTRGPVAQTPAAPLLRKRRAFEPFDPQLHFPGEEEVAKGGSSEMSAAAVSAASGPKRARVDAVHELAKGLSEQLLATTVKLGLKEEELDETIAAAALAARDAEGAAGVARAMLRERDVIREERNKLLGERDITIALACRASAERDAAREAASALLRERDVIREEHNKLRVECDNVNKLARKAEQQRDNALEGANKMFAEHDAVRKRCDIALAQKDKAGAERDRACASLEVAGAIASKAVGHARILIAEAGAIARKAIAERDLARKERDLARATLTAAGLTVSLIV